MKSVRRLPAILAVVCIAPGHAALAQGFPSQPVRIVVSTGAGGGLDLAARQLAQKLAESWTGGVLVENRTGAGGTIGVTAVARAAPDGHTLAFISTSFATNASVYGKLPYDSLRDFAPVSQTAWSPLMLVVNPSLPVRSVKDLVALAKQRPGQINYATTGTGGVLHLAGELLKSMAGIDLVHVPYKGTVPAVTDVIGGQVEVTITGLPVAIPQVAARKLRALAVTGTRRSAIAPEIPTIGESVPGYEFNNWHGIIVPAATPKDVVARLHAGIVRALQTMDLRQKVLEQGDEPVGSTSVQFADLIHSEIGKYAKLVNAIGVRVQ